MELALDLLEAMPKRIAPHVSILVFVELALDLRTQKTQTDRSMRFQSLFSWNSLLISISLQNRYKCYIWVSILVFVELALDRALRWEIVIASVVSILVFVELALDQ